MATEVKVPTLGESVTEATVGQWLKKPGEAVAADEPIVSLETDKVAVDVPAPAAGTMGDIVAKALAVQLQAAKSVAEYTHSKKPVQAEVKVGVDGVIFMPAASALGQSPVEQVMGNIASAVNDGRIDPAQLADLRIVDGEFAELLGDDEEGEDDV